MENNIKITVEVSINESIERVWECWTCANDIINWNTASDDWHTIKAENVLIEGGKFNYRMEAKDGSIGFDFWGIHDKIIQNQLIVSTLGDGRKLEVYFIGTEYGTKITETFEAETENPIELQKLGWQEILNNFKKYVEEKY